MDNLQETIDVLVEEIHSLDEEYDEHLIDQLYMQLDTLLKYK